MVDDAALALGGACHQHFLDHRIEGVGVGLDGTGERVAAQRAEADRAQDRLLARLKRMTNLEDVIWAQEEPRNQGYWAHVAPRIERRLGEAGLKPKRPVYAGREPAASPATGLAWRHAAEQAAVIADALGHREAAPVQRKAS